MLTDLQEQTGELTKALGVTHDQFGTLTLKMFGVLQNPGLWSQTSELLWGLWHRDLLAPQFSCVSRHADGRTPFVNE